MTFTLPPLPYDYSALEPFFDTATMRLHHGKHHAAYVDNLNKAVTDYPDLQKRSIEDILRNFESIDPKIRQAIINHGGGHANHSFFWTVLAPPADSLPTGQLAAAIDSTFGSFAKFKEAFTAKAMGVFGSGWAFLIKTPEGKLDLKRHSFQNSPLSRGNSPLLSVDMWEHAYYLKYQNRRPEYLEAFWHLVNWPQVEKNFSSISPPS
jgi:Fe-Mn family superoxide dismutase